MLHSKIIDGKNIYRRHKSESNKWFSKNERLVPCHAMPRSLSSIFKSHSLDPVTHSVIVSAPSPPATAPAPSIQESTEVAAAPERAFFPFIAVTETYFACATQAMVSNPVLFTVRTCESALELFPAEIDQAS